MKRILEPEVMDTWEEAAEYGAMDFVEVNKAFGQKALEIRPEKGLILDAGTRYRPNTNFYLPRTFGMVNYRHRLIPKYAVWLFLGFLIRKLFFLFGLPAVYLATTVEDADFLAKGILSRLEENLKSVAFACFWNKRFSPFEIDDLKIAPILKKYQEPVEKKVNYLVVVKSIISGACVVRTNLNDLIQKIEPEKICIATPVIYYAAEEKLKSQFEKDISDKFQFFYFAKDDERTSEGEVIPGIGGMVYDRLGFKDQDDKNSYVPELVKKRRSQLIAV